MVALLRVSHPVSIRQAETLHTSSATLGILELAISVIRWFFLAFLLLGHESFLIIIFLQGPHRLHFVHTEKSYF